MQTHNWYLFDLSRYVMYKLVFYNMIVMGFLVVSKPGYEQDKNTQYVASVVIYRVYMY